MILGLIIGILWAWYGVVTAYKHDPRIGELESLTYAALWPFLKLFEYLKKNS